VRFLGRAEWSYRKTLENPVQGRYIVPCLSNYGFETPGDLSIRFHA